MNQDWEERALLTDPVLDLVLGEAGAGFEPAVFRSWA